MEEIRKRLEALYLRVREKGEPCSEEILKLSRQLDKLMNRLSKP